MNTEIKVQVRNSSSITAQVTTGLSQGDALLLVLFNIVLEKVIQNCSYGQREIQLDEAMI